MTGLLLQSTVTYLNQNIVPCLGALVIAGLTFRMIQKLMQSHDEEEPLKVGLKKCKKYIVLIVFTLVLSSMVTLIGSYYK